MIIGREQERQRLLDAYNSDMSEFVAVYGRRRVGKTFLVRETFKDKLTFQHSGMANSPKSKQLIAWKEALKDCGYKTTTPKTWIEAFSQLKEVIKQSREKRKVIFIDELPWMDTRSSGLIPALENFWNSWASARNDILLIVCGSATSWIMNKIVRNKGGLHNRIDYKIALQPFTLNECEQYALDRKLKLTRKQIVELYMVFGGIPFYWKTLQRGASPAQNIDNVIFSKNGELFGEFNALYSSLFKNPEPYVKVISLLADKNSGLTRIELIKAGGFIDNGAFGTLLNNLEDCGFIRCYNVMGKSKKDAIYQLTDPYTIFYYKFIRQNKTHDEAFWSHSLNKPVYYTWCGLSFELVCLLHIQQIKVALGISGVMAGIYSWRSIKTNSGAQIDLLIYREDGIVNLCEIKFTTNKWQMTDADLKNIQNKEFVFAREMKCSKAIHKVLISANGISENAYSNEFQNILDLNDLF